MTTGTARSAEETAQARAEYLRNHQVATTLPTLSEWKDRSKVGSAIGPPYRASDKALKTIDGLVELLQKKPVGGQYMYLLGELFFATMGWLNNYKLDPVHMQAGRRPAILGLNLTAAHLVGKALHCPPQDIGRTLHGIYGIDLVSHGATTDASVTGGTKEMYDKGVQYRERFRVFFRHGKAYTYNTSNAPILLDTTDMALSADGSIEHEQFDGRPGRRFVMSMSGSLFATNMKSLVSYHSCFMGGGAVMCSGTLLAVRGQITRIKNDSGHYQPIDTSLAKVLARLKAHGVDISKIIVEYDALSRTYGSGEGEGHVGAVAFLNQNGSWATLLRGAAIGRRRGKLRCDCKDCTKARSGVV